MRIKASPLVNFGLAAYSGPIKQSPNNKTDAQPTREIRNIFIYTYYHYIHKSFSVLQTHVVAERPTEHTAPQQL